MKNEKLTNHLILGLLLIGFPRRFFLWNREIIIRGEKQ